MRKSEDRTNSAPPRVVPTGLPRPRPLLLLPLQPGLLLPLPLLPLLLLPPPRRR